MLNPCEKMYDINLARSKSWPRIGCISILYTQGILQKDVTNHPKKPQPSNLLQKEFMDYNQLIIPSSENRQKEYFQNILSQKTKFCAFAVKSFLSSKYYMESLVRHVFVKILSEKYEKKCDYIGGYTFDGTNSLLRCGGFRLVVPRIQR